MSTKEDLEKAVKEAIRQVEERYPQLTEEETKEFEKIYSRLKNKDKQTTNLKDLRDVLKVVKRVIVPSLIRQEANRLKTVVNLYKP